MQWPSYLWKDMRTVYANYFDLLHDWFFTKPKGHVMTITPMISLWILWQEMNNYKPHRFKLNADRIIGLHVHGEYSCFKFF